MRQLIIAITILVLTVTQNHGNEAAKCKILLKKAIRQTPDKVSIDKASCPKSATLLMWLRAQNTANATEAKEFLEKYPNWPRASVIQRQVEQELYKAPTPDTQMIAWFRRFPPITTKGLKAFGNALLAQNQYDDQKFRQSFIDIDLTLPDLKEILKTHHKLLTDPALVQKAHNQLNKNQTSATELIIPLLKPGSKGIIKARLLLLKHGTPPKPDVSNNPDIRFEQARLHRKNRENEKASEILSTLNDHDSPELVWAERNLIARRLLEEKNYQIAYNTIKDHGLKKGANFANAEWLAGWLCLRFLNNPEQAAKHFECLADNVSTPISVARAQYWLGRAYKELEEGAKAQTCWSKAQKHIATYYGQLAHKELTGKQPAIELTPVKVGQNVRRSLESNELYQYMSLLQDIGEHAMAEAFAIHLGEQLKTTDEQALLTEIVHNKSGNHHGLKVYKSIAKTCYPLIPSAYPRVAIPKQTVEPALAHAIIRQESRFQPDAVSPAGATGLMQLMPQTAALVEKRYKFKKKRLTDPHHNIALGTYHLKDLMKKYTNSLILTAAAYNAGAAAVDEWIKQFGDPRAPGVNIIDWIELIPYAETRNYVQRVLENYHCYKK